MADGSSLLQTSFKGYGLTVMEIVKTSSGDLLVLKLSGSFDHGSSAHFRDSIDESARSGWHRILLDLENLEYISSAGLSAMVSARRKILSLHGQFGAFNPTEAVAKVLKLTNLDKVLIVDTADFFNVGIQSPSVFLEADTKRFARANGIDMEIYSLPSSEPMSCMMFGNPELLQNLSARELPSYRVEFDKGSLGLGIGSLGSEETAGAPVYGEILASCGAIAQSATDRGQVPDYSVACKDFVPSARLIYGAKLTGSFSTLVRFKSSDSLSSIELSKLIRTCMEEQKIQTAVIAILADCVGFFGAQMKHWEVSASAADRFTVPQVRDWLAFYPDHAHQHKMALIVGIATLQHHTLPQAIKPFLRQMSEDPNHTCHFHAAIFPSQPLKKRTIDLQSFVEELFEATEIQQVMHLLRDTRPMTGETETELKSGACWIESIDHSRVTEMQR